jgi:dipeptidyl aminopeptidase/acylaminoacyl peptidase
VVLQIEDHAADKDYHDVGKAEWTSIQDAYESAIDDLDRQALIDRNRVGIIGWSRSGMYVAYTLTHSEYNFAANAFTDTGGFGEWFYLTRNSAGQDSMDSDYGAAPFGPGLSNWLEMSPGFNLDRNRTPTLMWAWGNVTPLWDWYSVSIHLGIPAELWVLPNGAHDLADTEMRMTSVQRLVDWFCFWLKDEEDSDPTKRDQYARWRQMKAQRDNLLKQPRRPLLRWTPTPALDQSPYESRR